jgi:putative hemolysin
MRWMLAFAVLMVAPLLSLLFSTLTYALRDLSKVRLAEALGRRRRDTYYDTLVDHAHDLSFLTGTARLFCNFLLLLALIDLTRKMRGSSEPDWVEYLTATIVSTAILVVMSLALPRALAVQSGEEVIAFFARPLNVFRKMFASATKLLHAADGLVSRARPSKRTEAESESLVQEEILEAVTEGARLGAVDHRQRKLIERVIEFRDLTVDEIMTPRQDVVALPITATFEELVGRFEASGHSRVPIYEESVDHIAGVIYARDLLRYLRPDEQVDAPKLRAMMRQPLFVPRTNAVDDLLQEFKLKKIHIAIVLDEYGGTAGLLTIEDVMEQLVGEISDEHEPTEPTMFHRTGPDVAECDARIYVADLNRLLGSSVPEDDADYETLGGFVTKTLERIPAAGTTFDAHGARFTVLAAVPARVQRVRIELLEKI